MKRNIYFSALAALALVAAASCAKDGDTIYTNGPTKAELSSEASHIVLSKDHPNALALTFYWNDNGDITLENPMVAAPDNAVSNTIEFGADEAFDVKCEETVPGGVYERQYSVLELNNITGRLGMEGGAEHALYIRVRSSVGANVEPVYSDVLRLTVVPFFIDWTTGFYLDKDQNETGAVLRSPLADGVFTAFVSVGAWENWFFRDPVNAVWGNLAEDGKVFYASSENKWNFWFPAPSGSYYITVNTNEAWWSSLHIDNLTLAGDVNGEMLFNKAENKWYLPVEMPAAATVNVTISGQASLYNTDSGDSAPADVRTVAFSGAATALAFGATASAVSIDVPAGQSSIVLDLNDVLAPSLSVGASAPVVTVPEKLYFSGLVNWNGFDDYLTLTDEEARTYGGAHWIDSEWGYRAYTEPDWAAAYKAGDGSDAMAGTLVVAETDGNIPAPEKGLYVMNYNMSALSYVLTKVESVTCAGIGDDWAEKELVADAENPEIYRYEYVKAAATPWGVKVLFNHDWNLFLGAGPHEGIAYLRTDSGAQGFAGDDAFETGNTVVLTIDLGKQTFTYSLK